MCRHAVDNATVVMACTFLPSLPGAATRQQSHIGPWLLFFFFFFFLLPVVSPVSSSEGNRVDAGSLKALLPAPSAEVQVYVCGPGSMTKAVSGGKGTPAGPDTSTSHA